MACKIGTSINLCGLHEVQDTRDVTVSEFNEELDKALKSIYPGDDYKSKVMYEKLREMAKNGLCNFHSVHIAGKFFFCR